MTLEALVDPLVRSSLLIALAWGASFHLRGPGASAAMRHLVWLLALSSLLLIPFLSALLPRLPLPILPELPAPAVAPGPAPAAAAIAVTALVPETPATPVDSIGLGDFLQLLYLAIAAGLLGRLALGHALLARLWRRSTVLDDPRSSSLLAGLAASLAIGRPILVRIAAGPAMPMTWGSLRPRILLPADAAHWDEERLRIVLLHELAHVARHDSLSRAAAAIVCALYWFNPAVWYAVRQMRREQEHACDDLVLSLGAKASVYARNLLDAAHAFHAPRIVGTLSVAMASPSELERRLTAIVSRGSRRRASLRFLIGCGGAALVATSVAASVVPVAAEPPVPTLSSTKPIRRAGAPYEAGHAAITAPTSATMAQTAIGSAAPRAPRTTDQQGGPSRGAVTAHASRPDHLHARTSAGNADVENYARALAQHRRDLDAYRIALARYHRQVEFWRQDVRRLRAEGNLANSGNSGNGGNSGNSGQPPRPAHGDQEALPAVMPTPPIMPVPPTPPVPSSPAVPVTPLKQGP